MSIKRTIVIVAVCLSLLCSVQAESPTLRLIQTIPLPGVEGRIDHMAVDGAGQRLFVAAIGNGSVEILDLRAGKRIHSITELREPQGVAYVPEANQFYVACGGDGAIKVYDAKSFNLVTTLRDLDDADNIRYDAAAKCVLVGYGSGTLAIIDATTAKHIGDIKLAGHPESFQLEQKGNRIFVNVPTAKHVAIIDREKSSVIATWLLKSAAANFPMALDEGNRRLFVGCRQSAALIVLDSDSGKDVAAVAIDSDTDDVFYDQRRSRIYISCGAGFIDVLDCTALLPYSVIDKIPTASGARTSLFVPELNRLYLAVPHRGNQSAEVRVYETTGN
jgi:DNA-binding beta-propeller fold protein YncE